MRLTLTVLGLIAVGALVGALALSAISQRPLSQPELRRLEADASEAEARAAKAWVDARTEQQAAGAILASKELARIGQAAAGNILLLGLAASISIAGIGGAVAGAKWVVRRVDTVYPDKSGIWPILIAHGKDRVGHPWIIAHDPNRSLGPTAMYQLTAQAQPTAEYPQPADTATMAQIATQAQAISLVAASGSTPTQHTAERFLGTMLRPHPAADLPEIRPSQWDVSHIDRLLLEAGEPG